jgi:hypothetical protein
MIAKLNSHTHHLFHQTAKAIPLGERFSQLLQSEILLALTITNIFFLGTYYRWQLQLQMAYIAQLWQNYCKIVAKLHQNCHILVIV